ncbi:phosphotransferase family protein [Brachybacterium ginsengisoli]|nr:phosphotransferase [Brachybacterium ginsengisoli]
MPGISVAEVLDALGVHADPVAPALTGGMSGSSVLGAVTPGGEPVVVKVSSFGTPESSHRARRELDVYTELLLRVPLPAPRLVAAHRTEEWIAIALERHRPAPPASEWTSAQWHDLAVLLGKLHAGSRELAGRFAPLHAVSSRPVDELAVFAQQLWNGEGDDARLEAACSALDRLHDAVSDGPASFVHGDSHLGNVVLTTDGTLLLVDWQSAHVGPSIGDVAFALTRAAAAAGSIPRDQVIEAYSAAAGTASAAVHRSITAQQLLILVEQYPEFATFLGPGEVAGLRSAFDLLLEDWAERQ